MKGLPLAYDRDLQEDKAPVFAARRDPRSRSRRSTVLVSGLDVDRERLAAAASDPLLLATDAAEALVRDGVPSATRTSTSPRACATAPSPRPARRGERRRPRRAPGPAACARRSPRLATGSARPLLEPRRRAEAA